MYGFVCRFDKNNMFLKEYIDSGNLGDIYYAEAERTARCVGIGGWFRDKNIAGGGMLMAIALFMGIAERRKRERRGG